MSYQPPIRYFGSKARMVPALLQLIDQKATTYAEPFMGSAAVLFGKPRHAKEHLNDMDGRVVGLFRLLRDEKARLELVRRLALTPWAQEEFRACQEAMRTGVEIEDPVEAARCYLVCAFQGRAGVRRARTGFRGTWVADTRPEAEWSALGQRLQAAAERLMGVTIWQRPALEMVERLAGDRDAVLFVDPPYPASTLNTNDRYAVTMSDEEHHALAAALAQARAQVIFTCYPWPAYDEAFAGWHRQEVAVRGQLNTVRTEIIWCNRPATTGSSQISIFDVLGEAATVPAARASA